MKATWANISEEGAGFYSNGIPLNSILGYETAIKSELCIPVLYGSADELVKAKDVLKNADCDVQVHPV